MQGHNLRNRVLHAVPVHEYELAVGKIDHVHGTVASKIAYIASHTFAMDAMTWFTSGLADRGDADIRLEAAMAKLFNTETAWTIADETLQIRGGRGYETADSLRGRGEEPVPAERMLRDCRINRIIEGTSEIMRLFIAREALDFHMQIAGSLLKKFEFGPALKVVGKYATWFPKQCLYWALPPKYNAAYGSKLAAHLRFVERSAHKLARNTFYCMALYQARLEKRQQILARIVEIGVDLFAVAVTCASAHSKLSKSPDDRSPLELDADRHQIHVQHPFP